MGASHGVPPRLPVMIPAVAVYVRVDASAADGAASMDVNAISPTESVWNERRIMIVALGMRRRALRNTHSVLYPTPTVSNKSPNTIKSPHITAFKGMRMSITGTRWQSKPRLSPISCRAMVT